MSIFALMALWHGLAFAELLCGVCLSYDKLCVMLPPTMFMSSVTTGMWSVSISVGI